MALEIPPQPSEQEATRVRSMNERIAHVLQMVRYWDGTSSVPVPREMLPTQIQADMLRWRQEFLKESCPIAATEQNCRAIAMDSDSREDVVICDAQIGERKATIYETARQIGLLVSTDVRDASDAESLHESVREISAVCLAADLRWQLRASSAVDGPVALSTNIYQNIWNATSWDKRVDAGTLDNRIYILLYKRINQVFGLASSQWFDEDFRAQVKALSGSSPQRTK